MILYIFCCKFIIL